MGRRQHAPVACRRLRRLRAVHVAQAGERARAAFTGLVPGHELTPVDYGDVCINYDKALVRATRASRRRRPSTTSRKPAYKDQLVVENPATSSPGLVFLLATMAKYGAGRLAGSTGRTCAPTA